MSRSTTPGGHGLHFKPTLDAELVSAVPGTTNYTLLAADGRRRAGLDTLQATVMDTTPPTLSELTNDGPQCLWAPNHKYVVLRIGQELTANVEDVCDPNAQLIVAGATSDQPDNAEGDGNTVNDVVVFDDRVCLRSERQGGDHDGRLYTVELKAQDASGNATGDSLQVRVVHDQSNHDCPRLDAELFVDDGDPLCTPSTSP